MSSLLDIAFPYRNKKSFGAASFAFVFLLLLGEIEGLVFVALAIVAHRADLFLDLQQVILPGACLISLSSAAIFWWRARSWSKARIEMLDLWAQGGTSYGERLAKSRQQRT